MINKKKRPEEARFTHALEFIEVIRDTRPELPTELVDSVLDGLVDLLRNRPEYGQSRAAVFALGRKQLGWRIKDWQRKRMEADGEMKSHPSAARSLDRQFTGVDGEGGNLYSSVRNGSAHDPERIYLAKEELGEIIERAEQDGLNTLRTIVAEMYGLTPRELAEAHGARVNTVHQWRCRFVGRYPKESE